MIAILGGVLSLLFTTEASLIPRLDRSFCKSEAVVVASVVQIAMSESSSDPEYIRMRVTDWVKGDFRAPGCFVVKGELGFQDGVSYLMFLSVKPGDHELYEGVRQSDSCALSEKLPVLGENLRQPMAVDGKGLVDIDPGWVVLPPELLSYEDALSLRSQNRSVSLPLDAVFRFFGTLSDAGCAQVESGGA